MARILLAGWGGVMLWQMGEGAWMGKLIALPVRWERDQFADLPGLWDYAPTAEAALAALVDLAERLGSPGEREGQ